MISIEEILKGKPLEAIPLDHQFHLHRLHTCANFIRFSFNAPLVVSSGYRTWQDHVQIYREKNAMRANQGLSLIEPPKSSLHLIGAALDFSDPSRVLQTWISTHLDVAESLEIYFEDFRSTPDWVHLQIYPPFSGKRFFIP